MRIALTADPELPVPPRLYGGIERIVDMLARELVSRGHEVTLFANLNSTSAGRLVPWPGLSSNSSLDTVRNSEVLFRSAQQGDFDLIHSFSRIAYLLPLLPLRIPKLMTYQRVISRRSVRLGHVLSRGSLWFSAISRWMMREVQDVGTWRMVFNGVPLHIYECRTQVPPDAPLVFLGRVEAIKGPHLAIQVAQLCGRNLVIAGNIPSEHQAWFDKEIRPRLDGRKVRYVGPVNDAQKSALLGEAAAFLMPILWDEPFGIVMTEAMACGTPVIGLARGSVPEIVEDGVTGFVASNLDGLVNAVRSIDHIDRLACRERVERLFSQRAVTDAYLAVYEEMLVAAHRRTG